MIVITLVIIFIYILEQQQLQYADYFSKGTIEISDFTLRLGNLPDKEYYGGSQGIMRIKLWHLLQNVLNNEAEMKRMKLYKNAVLPPINEDDNYL